MDWELHRKNFSRVQEGSFIYDKIKNKYYIKPEQNADNHLENTLIELFTGKLVHFSILKNITEVYGSEIQW
jgi:hypothetical protein